MQNDAGVADNPYLAGGRGLDSVEVLEVLSRTHVLRGPAGPAAVDQVRAAVTYGDACSDPGHLQCGEAPIGRTRHNRPVDARIGTADGRSRHRAVVERGRFGVRTGDPQREQGEKQNGAAASQLDHGTLRWRAMKASRRWPSPITQRSRAMLGRVIAA